jgi:2-(1,2-epoxy-1,2-dihydrophenyl)acetyl-CoA isomerase
LNEESVLLEPVTLTRDNHVAVITFNRPEHMNALNREMIRLLADIVNQVKKDPYIRIVVMRGLGEVFMAGSDLHEVYGELDSGTTEMTSLIRQFNAVTLALREMDKIVLASVHGLVAGQGMSLMLASDLVIASDTARFSLGFCNIGTSPTGGISTQLPRLVGNKKAMELLLMSELFDAATAASLGLINWVVTQDEQADKVRNVIERIIQGPTLAYTQTKQLINSAWQNKLSVQLELESESFVKTVNSKDFKAAVRAFVNKRQPEFEGR